MPDQTLTQRVWSRGIVRDSARHAIPEGGVYDAQDFLFDVPGEVYKRGGSGFQSEELTDETILVAVAAPEFPGDPRVVVIGSDGSDRTLYDVTGDEAAEGIDVNGAQPTENPPLYVDRLILTDGLGDGSGNYADVQKVYLDGSDVDVADLGGSPPNCRCSCVHNDLLVLANGTDPNDSDALHTNRVWFGPTGENVDIEDTWDTTLAWLDVGEPVTGLASVSGVLLVFSRGNTWRVLGSVPPGTTGEDMSVQPLGQSVGCIDARSIVQMGSLVFFADESGVYYTNGVGAKSVTGRDDGTGIGRLWAEAVAGYSPALGSVVCAGVWRNEHLFVTVRHADSDPQSGARYQFLYHHATGAWARLSDGVTADMYATRFAPDGELYAACGDSEDPVRLLTLSGIFTPTEANSSDANGEEVEPTIEFRPFAASPALKAYGFGHLTSAVDSGSGEVLTRKRFDAFADSEAMSVKVAQSGASSSTRILALEMEARAYDADSELAA